MYNTAVVGLITPHMWYQIPAEKYVVDGLMLNNTLAPELYAFKRI